MVFNYSGKVYSISDKNENGEFVIVKMSGDGKTIEDARIAKSNSKENLQKRIKTLGMGRFMKLPGFEKEIIDNPVN